MKKEIIIATISGLFLIACAVISSPHWFKYFFPEQYLEQEKIEPQRKKEENKNVKEDTLSSQQNAIGNLVISKIDLIPREFDLPSYLYFEVINNGTATIRDLTISVDLGKSKFQKFDYTKQVNSSITIDSTNKSFVKIFCPQIKETETIEFYFLNSSPFFKSIILNAKNMAYYKKYTYEEYLESQAKDSTTNIFVIVLSIAFVIFAIYFTVIAIIRLNRYFKI